jgi:hypothetical protein
MTALPAPYNAGPNLFCLPYIPVGYQQITSLAGAQSLTVPSGATACLISCSVAGVRYRDDGVAPTAGIGMPMGPGGSPLLYAGSLAAIQFIQTAAGAVLDVLYYK